MGSLLLTVTDTFALRNGWLILDPELAQSPGSGEFAVVLRRPDGTERPAVASVVLPFVNRHPYTPPGWVCILRGMPKTEVPAGTEVWLVGEASEAAPGTSLE